MMVETERTPLLRTDFSDDSAWQAVRAAVEAPVGGGLARACTESVDDRRLADLTSEQILASIPHHAPYAVVIVADGRTMTEAARPMLVIGLADRSELRCVPEALWALLSDTGVKGMGLAEFLDDVGGDGLFRGRGGPRGLERRLEAVAALRGSGATHRTAPESARRRQPGIPGPNTTAFADGRPNSRGKPGIPTQPPADPA
ncbi:hypothetical protein AB0I51_12545 [Streptomyces sp. NPDC050549]|uniref:DUF6924 domain-containing protein n=1 Tax=Streptomyces sp. NPDC050549 TaxID=3155406 RepID=UPI00343EDFE9